MVLLEGGGCASLFYFQKKKKHILFHANGAHFTNKGKTKTKNNILKNIYGFALKVQVKFNRQPSLLSYSKVNRQLSHCYLIHLDYDVINLKILFNKAR